jgi:hypothetical protein
MLRAGVRRNRMVEKTNLLREKYTFKDYHQFDQRESVQTRLSQAFYLLKV